jgi:hypothetical protein
VITSRLKAQQLISELVLRPGRLARGQRTPARRARPSRRTFVNGKIVERPGEEAT